MTIALARIHPCVLASSLLLSLVLAGTAWSQESGPSASDKAARAAASPGASEAEPVDAAAAPTPGKVAPADAATVAAPAKAGAAAPEAASEQAAPASEQAAPAPEQAAPAPEQAAPASKQAAPASKQAAPASEQAAPAPAPESEQAAPKASLDLGGALRFNYFVKSWDGEEANRARFGDLAFDTLRLNVDATYDILRLSAEYRFYAGYSMLHHGYVGLDLGETKVDLGMTQAPFGILPYASHSWFFNLGYYLGFEDDYDAGIKVSHKFGNLDLQAAFFKNSEGSYTGSSLASARYSYDVVPTTTAELGYAGLTENRANSETNQANVRVAYTLDHGEGLATEIGVSGRLGQLYNAETTRFGAHWAAAAHLHGSYGPFDLQLQGVAYQFNPANPAGGDDRFVVMGAYDAPYLVAARGYLLSGGLAYEWVVDKGPLHSLTFYDDFSALLKPESGYADSMQNVLGVLVSAGPVYTYIDFAMGKNQPWMGPNYGAGLAEGDADAGWDKRFNVNVGWYF